MPLGRFSPPLAFTRTYLTCPQERPGTEAEDPDPRHHPL